MNYLHTKMPSQIVPRVVGGKDDSDQPLEETDPEGRMGFKFGPENKRKLQERARQAGLSPTQFIIQRAIDGAESDTRESVPTAEEIADKVAERLQQALPTPAGQVCIPLGEPQQVKLGALAELMGLHSPEDLMKDLVLKALSDPQAAQQFLFSGVRERAKARVGGSARGERPAAKGKAA